MLNDNNFNLYLIRHGQSEINIQPDIMGQPPDTPLTTEGRSQALCLRRFLRQKKIKFDLAYSSHYTRAFDTAAIVMESSKTPIILAEELREYDAGDWSGTSRKANLTDEVRLKMTNMNCNFLPPNGESVSQVARRSSKWLEETILYNLDIMKLSKDKPLNIVAFSHGLTIKSLLHYIMDFDRTFIWKMSIDNTSVSKVSFGQDGWKVHYINNCSHLD